MVIKESCLIRVIRVKGSVGMSSLRKEREGMKKGVGNMSRDNLFVTLKEGPEELHVCVCPFVFQGTQHVFCLKIGVCVLFCCVSR